MNILIVNQNWLGDVLFSTPAIRAIKKKFPESHLACLVPGRAVEALKNNPYLNEIIPYDEKTPLLYFWKWAALAARLKKKRFDKAIFFHRSKTKVFLAKLAGIPERLGYSAPFRENLLTGRCPAPQKPVHKIDFFIHLIEYFGIPSDGRTMDFYPDPRAEAGLRALLEENGISKDMPYAVLHAGGNWPLKRWPAEYFAKWIDLFRKEFKGKIVLCGTAEEERLALNIRAYFPDTGIVSLCGQTSLDMLALLLKNAQLLLSNDSGPIHLAATQKTKILGLYGPTSPDLTGPVSAGEVKIFWKDVGCQVPCYFRSCNYRVCMELLTPQEVFESTKLF